MVEIEEEARPANPTSPVVEQSQASPFNLEGKKLIVATPCYGGNCHSAFMISCIQLTVLASKTGLPLDFLHLFNESLVQRARNRLVANFLKTDATHLMFIDADLGFNAVDVLHLLDACSEERPVVGGTYSKKSIQWARVASAVQAGITEPEVLAAAGVDACISFKRAGQVELDLQTPVEVHDLPTGFMMIHRSVFEKMKALCPNIRYTEDAANEAGEEMHAFFDCYIDASGRYLSEDYGFVRRWQSLGGTVFLCPWITTRHYGSYGFPMDLAALARNHIVL